MNIGLIIVGDEILSGRRKDRHFSQVVELLSARGLSLSWSQILSDDMDLLVKTYQDSFARGDLVFSTGGIGATPDDLTRQAVATALGLELEYHPEAIPVFKDKYKERLTEDRMRMIEFPKGASLIPNPVNRVPGFSYHDHHFTPGFPEMAWPMIEWVLDHRYPHLCSQDYCEIAIHVFLLHEGDLIPVMDEVLEKFTDIKVFSLPTINKETPYVELGVKGGRAQAQAAMNYIHSKLETMNCEWKPTHR